MLSTLIASVVSGEAADALARARRAFVVYVAAAVLALCGAAFLIGAAFIATAREIGVLPASLWFGGGFLGGALLLVVVHRVAANVKARRVARRRKNEAKAMASAAAIAMLPTLLAGRGRSLVLIAPAFAAVAWAVWRENASRTRGGRRDDEG